MGENEHSILDNLKDEFNNSDYLNYGFPDYKRTPKEEYKYNVYTKLTFYQKNDIIIKFRLIEPKGHYEFKGNIVNRTDQYVTLKYNNQKFIILLYEIDIHTICPLDYNPVIEFIRREIPEEIKNEVYRRANYLCQLKLEGCTIKADSIDHIIPIISGGGDNIENLQAACIHCNCKKGSKILY